MRHAIIASAAWSVPTEPRDQGLISRAICAWQPNAKYCQPLDQRSSAARSASANYFISTFQPLNQRCQPLDQRLSGVRSTSVNDFITTGQPLDQHLEAALSSPNQLCDQHLLIRLISTCPPLYQQLSTAWSATTLLRHGISLEKLFLFCNCALFRLWPVSPENS